METKTGLYLVVSDDTELVSALSHIQARGMEIRVWVPGKSSQLQRDLLSACRGNGGKDLVAPGNLGAPDFYDQWERFSTICVVLAMKDTGRRQAIRDTIMRELPTAKILTLQLADPEQQPRSLDVTERELTVSWAELLARPVAAELRHLSATHHVHNVRNVLDDGDKVGLLLQPDPDPDGLASALALRVLLGRNKISTPFLAFGKVTRPENLAMMRLLDLEVHTISVDDLRAFDRIALLDVQPAHFGSVKLPRLDAIIDHHPLKEGSMAPHLDIRPSYGATSSIMTEYLHASAINIGQRLATALLYGIKSDTLFLNREVIDADLDAFISLYPDINYNLLRRMEKPELPMRFAPVLASALRSMVKEQGVLSTCLGQVEREDLIPQVADFLMQFEDVEWVLCSGIYDDDVVVSIRNVGYVRSAGEIVKRIVSDWALGGGHRTMAKMIIPISIWKAKFGSLQATTIRDRTLKLVLEELE